MKQTISRHDMLTRNIYTLDPSGGVKYTLLVKMCAKYELPPEIAIYIALKFFMPFHKAALENGLIKQAYDYWLIDPETRYPNIHGLFGIPMTLDSRVMDGRIEMYVDFIASVYTELPPNLIVSNCEVLFKGLELDSIRAFALLIRFQLLHRRSKLIPDFLSRVIKKIDAMPVWQEKDIRDICTMIYYFLDNDIDEPLIKWYDMCLHKEKGLNPFSIMRANTTVKQQIKICDIHDIVIKKYDKIINEIFVRIESLGK